MTGSGVRVGGSLGMVGGGLRDRCPWRSFPCSVVCERGGGIDSGDELLLRVG
jgi:hypothetical protein